LRFDEDGREELDFWADEPTQPLRRIAADTPQRGSRSHTGAVPVVAVRETKDGWLPSRGRRPDGRLDPFWARLGMLVGATALIIPVAVIVRSTGDAAPRARSASVPSSTVVHSASSAAEAPSTAAPTAAPSLAPSTAADAAQAQEVLVAADPTSTSPPETAAPESSARSTATSARSRRAATTATAAAVPTLPSSVSCSNTYKVAAGDFWLGIAQKTGAKIKDLLAANHATAQTVLYPNLRICLPAGASAPAKPTPTTAKPAPATAAPTTAAPTTAAPTTAVPTTAPPSTAAPTTAAPRPAPTSTPAASPPPNSYTRDQIVQIIRDVWPDDQEDKAIAIATRESNLIPTVRNYCCFGLFQIYYSQHKSWLAAMGVTSPEQLYDPKTNTLAAYALYVRAGGWGPWGG
jgi:LysM repeat protein